MGVTLYYVKGLIQKRFPDALFDRLHGEPKEPIVLVPDPHQRRKAGTQSDLSNEAHPEVMSRASYSSNESVTRDVETADATSNLADSPVSQHNVTKESNEHFVGLYRWLPFLRSQPAQEVEPPKSTLELIFDSMSEGRRRLYDVRKKQWRNWPKANQQNNNDIAVFLNDIVDAARRHLNGEKEVLKSDTDRVFCAKYANAAVKRDGEIGKPDIVLIPRGRRDDSGKKNDGWRWISAVGEVKSNSDLSERDLVCDLAEYGRLCFGSQRSRRFVLSFSLINNKLHLWKFDRSGILVSEQVDVHKEPLDFLRVILGLALGDDYYLGLDPSFFHKKDKKGGKDYVKLNEEEYEVVKEIHFRDGICGRGSVVLLVKDRFGNLRVMKDQWVDRSDSKEFDILNVLTEKNIDNVVKLIDFQYVHFKADSDDPIPDTTETDRNSKDVQEEIKKRDIETRDHYRILITPYGNKIESFRSLVELVSAFRDYIEVIKRLHENDIVHRDISVNNVVLVEVPGSPLRKGYLIDFDCAILQSGTHPSQVERAGTLPFIAVDVLMEKRTAHQYYHDIESLFYVLVWVCILQDGPGSKRRDFSETAPSLLHQWYKSLGDEETMPTIAYVKYAMTTKIDGFTAIVLSQLPAYFKPLENLLLGLRGIIFEPDILRPRCGDPKGIKDRDAESVFKEIDALFAQELAKLDEKLSSPVAVEADKQRPLVVVEAAVASTGRETEKSTACDADFGVEFVSPLPTRQQSKMLCNQKFGEQSIASTSTGGTSNLGMQAMDRTKMNFSRGEKRTHDREDVAAETITFSPSKRRRRSI